MNFNSLQIMLSNVPTYPETLAIVSLFKLAPKSFTQPQWFLMVSLLSSVASHLRFITYTSCLRPETATLHSSGSFQFDSLEFSWNLVFQYFWCT